MKKSKAVSPVFTARCAFPEVFENRETDEYGLKKRPKSEIIYSRSDYNGHKWYTTW